QGPARVPVDGVGHPDQAAGAGGVTQGAGAEVGLPEGRLERGHGGLLGSGRSRRPVQDGRAGKGVGSGCERSTSRIVNPGPADRPHSPPSLPAPGPTGPWRAQPYKTTGPPGTTTDTWSIAG